MHLSKETLNQIVERLKPVDPYKIVLFGSYAKGEAARDSDIDLMVVLDVNAPLKSYDERSFARWKIRKSLLDIDYPFDLKIYSKAELRILRKRGGFFIKEIEKTGQTIYEKRN